MFLILGHECPLSLSTARKVLGPLGALGPPDLVPPWAPRAPGGEGALAGAPGALPPRLFPEQKKIEELSFILVLRLACIVPWY